MKSYNFVLPGIMLIFLICLLIFSTKRRWLMRPSKVAGENPLRICPNEFIQLRHMWFNNWIWWLFINYAILIIGFLSSMIVLYINAMNLGSKSETIIYSVIAASMTVFGYVINPKKHADGFRRAFVTLDNAIREYTHISKGDNSGPLVEAAKQGEEYISTGSNY